MKRPTGKTKSPEWENHSLLGKHELVSLHKQEPIKSARQSFDGSAHWWSKDGL